MSKIQSIPIDGQKLRNEFEKRNVNHYELSVQCGYSRKWFQNGILCNYVTPPMLVILREKFDISLDDLKADPVEETAEEVKTGDPVLLVRDMTQGDLFETISDGMQDAFRSIKAELQSVVYDAMKDALRGE